MRKMTQQELVSWNKSRPRRTLEAMDCLRRVLRNSRSWHFREQVNSNWSMHPAIEYAVFEADPLNWHQLVLEWPHQSDSGPHQIAYTRDDKYGEADRQITVGIAKYLTRHFPTIPSDTIRNIAAKYAQGSCKFVHTTIEMLDVIENGPASCMAKGAGNFHGGRHPYEAYAPEFGWHMAVFIENGAYTGRALCNSKEYVRSYRGGTGESYSCADDRLEAWLQDQGYAKTNSWEGHKLKRVVAANCCGFLAPYIDGGAQHVCEVHDGFKIVDDEDDAEWEFTNTDGTADNAERGDPCNDCGDRVSGDDGYWVGRSEDDYVCQHCIDNHYTYVYGRNRARYYLHDNDVVHCNDAHYDAHYLSDNNIVETADGEYLHEDDAVFIHRLDEYHPTDDCVYCEHSSEYELQRDCEQLADGEWAHADDVWCCEHSGEYYLDDDADSRYETECGKTVHIDHADHYAPEQTILELE